jgi:hypothetical protein
MRDINKASVAAREAMVLITQGPEWELLVVRIRVRVCGSGACDQGPELWFEPFNPRFSGKAMPCWAKDKGGGVLISLFLSSCCHFFAEGRIHHSSSPRSVDASSSDSESVIISVQWRVFSSSFLVCLRCFISGVFGSASS